LQLLLNGPVSVDLEAQLDLFIRKNSPTQAKHLFAHYIGEQFMRNIQHVTAHF